MSAMQLPIKTCHKTLLAAAFSLTSCQSSSVASKERDSIVQLYTIFAFQNTLRSPVMHSSFISSCLHSDCGYGGGSYSSPGMP